MTTDRDDYLDRNRAHDDSRAARPHIVNADPGIDMRRTQELPVYRPASEWSTDALDRLLEDVRSAR